MSVAELIERHYPDHAHGFLEDGTLDPYFAKAHLKHFAIELLELVKARGRCHSCREGTGYAVEQALEELQNGS